MTTLQLQTHNIPEYRKPNIVPQVKLHPKGENTEHKKLGGFKG